MRHNKKSIRCITPVNSPLKDPVEHGPNPFHTTRKELLLINCFLSPGNEQCSKILLVSLTDTLIPGFLFKAQDKKILELRSKHQQLFGEGKEVFKQEALFGPFLNLLLGKTTYEKRI